MFVPTKRQALVTAVDMVTFASAWQADQELEAPLFTDAARQSIDTFQSADDTPPVHGGLGRYTA